VTTPSKTAQINGLPFFVGKHGIAGHLRAIAPEHGQKQHAPGDDHVESQRRLQALARFQLQLLDAPAVLVVQRAEPGNALLVGVGLYGGPGALRVLGEPGTMAVVWHQTGVALQAAGRGEAAEDAYGQALATKVRLGDWAGQADTLGLLPRRPRPCPGRHRGPGLQHVRRAAAPDRAPDGRRHLGGTKPEARARRSAAPALAPLIAATGRTAVPYSRADVVEASGARVRKKAVGKWLEAVERTGLPASDGRSRALAGIPREMSAHAERMVID
jgi:hypothetical protein